MRVAAVTADPVAPPVMTGYLATELPRAMASHAGEPPFAPTNLADAVRLYGRPLRLLLPLVGLVDHRAAA